MPRSTKMDSLDWTKLNKNVRIAFTKKKYFNEFYYKLTYRVPGARLLTYKYTNDHGLLQHVAMHNDRWYHYHYTYTNIGTSWSTTRRYNQKADFDQLRAFFEVYNIKNDDIKFRIEQDTLNIYTKSEPYLYRLADVMLGDYKSCITEICRPESKDAKDKLDQGFTIVKKEPSHPYRVKLKEGFQHVAECQGLALYLKNLNDDVRITTFMLDRLNGKYKYFSGGYIYVKDRRIIDLLIMVSPNLIGTVNQLVINN